MSLVTTQILRNVLTGWVSTLVRAGIALIMIPFLLRHLGTEGFGLIALLSVITGLAIMADLGLRAALGREMAERAVHRDSLAMCQLASSALVVYLLIGGILSALCIVFATQIVHLFNVSEGLTPHAIRLTRIYGTGSILLSFITPVFSAALSSAHRFDIINSSQVACGLIANILVFIIIYWSGWGLYGWVSAMLAGELMCLLWFMAMTRKVCPALRISVRYVGVSQLKPLFRIGGYMYVLQLTQSIAERSDPVVISHFFGPAGVSLYSPGQRISQIVRPIVTMLSDQLYPLATQDHVQGNIQRQKRVILEGTRYLVLLGGLFSAGIAVYAFPFCKLWLGEVLGPSYRVAAWIMTGWACVDFLTYIGGTAWPVVLAMKRLGFVTILHVVTSVLNILISIWLVGYTSLGIPGVLIATIIMGAIRRPIFIVVIARWCGIPLGEYIREAYAKPLIVTGISLAIMMGIRTIIPISGYPALILAVVLSGFSWAVLCWLIGLNARDRKMILSSVSGLRSKFNERKSI